MDGLARFQFGIGLCMMFKGVFLPPGLHGGIECLLLSPLVRI